MADKNIARSRFCEGSGGIRSVKEHLVPHCLCSGRGGGGKVHIRSGGTTRVRQMRVFSAHPVISFPPDRGGMGEPEE